MVQHFEPMRQLFYIDILIRLRYDKRRKETKRGIPMKHFQNCQESENVG